MTLIEQIQQAGIADGFGSPYMGAYAMQQDPGEFAQLVQILMDKKPQNYLQVGSAAGGSERFICERAGIKDLTIMDLGTHPEFHIWREVNRPALEAQGVTVTEFLGDSHSDEAEAFLATQNRKYDLIGIDGDHTPAGARMDWKLIVPCLKPGTLVWLHDTNAANMRPCDNGAWEVFEKLMERHIVLLDVREVFGIGLVEIV
jgi:cephalosporin hydroxylase